MPGNPAARRRDAWPASSTLVAFDGEPDFSFPLRGRLLGHGGENLRYICEQARARISLEGSGSTRKGQAGAAVSSPEEDVPLRLRITARSNKDLEAAVEMARELLQHVREAHDRWVARRAAVPCGQAPHGRCPQGGGREGAARAAAERCLAEAGRLKGEAERLRAGGGGGCGPAIPEARLLEPDSSGPADPAKQGSSVAQSAAARYGSGKAFWRALETQVQEQALTERQVRSKAREAERKARALEQQAKALSSGGAGAGSGTGRMGGFCALFPMGACPFVSCKRPRGQHGEPQVPEEEDVIVRITSAKKRLLRQKWADAGGRGELVSVWQVRNPRLELLFRAAECDFAEALGRSSDVIDGWHGTAEQNVLSIAVHGFDPKRRCGQVYGAGEYFAKDPNVSIGYARGGAFMFLCKLLLGKAELDHTWADTAKYYVLKQRDCRVQALPLFLVQFEPSAGSLCRHLGAVRVRDTEDSGVLAARQRGGLWPCEARRDAGMVADSTCHLWIGWLAPELCDQDDDAVAEDVEAFLTGHKVAQVVPERNGARIGAFVLLSRPVNRAAFAALCSRRYRGEYRISVDDQQPCNPRCAGKACPRLTGPSHYCRGWNLRGHHAWQWGCPFEHPEEARPTHGAGYRLDPVPKGSAKYDEIETELLRSSPFVSADGSTGRPRIVAVQRVVNDALQRLYEERRGFLHDKHGFAVEKELWHGTNCKALPELLTHGLQPPADTRPSDACPRSGRKSLCTTLCGVSCPHCREAHTWDRCHMYGLGVYLADLAQKSHRYVREPGYAGEGARAGTGTPGRWQTVLAGKWCSFDAELQAVFDTARAAGARYHNFRARGWLYHLDLQRMVQVNLSTGRERPVRCLDGMEDAVAPALPAAGDQPVYSMLRCKVCLGNPYLIEGNLLKGDAMHNMCWCQDPGDALESCTEAWGVAKGHDSFYVRGLTGSQKAGLGVYNSEYIVFQPYQILPLYQVDYVLE